LTQCFGDRVRSGGEEPSRANPTVLTCLTPIVLVRDHNGGRALPRPVVPKGAVSLVAVLLSTRSKVVRTAMRIAIITATAKSKRAVWWLFRSFLMRESPLIVVCAANGSVWLVCRAERQWGRPVRWKTRAAPANCFNSGPTALQLD